MTFFRLSERHPSDNKGIRENNYQSRKVMGLPSVKRHGDPLFPLILEQRGL